MYVSVCSWFVVVKMPFLKVPNLLHDLHDYFPLIMIPSQFVAASVTATLPPTFHNLHRLHIIKKAFQLRPYIIYSLLS